MKYTFVMQTDNWNEDKARTNIKKHGLSFEEAKEVFYDPFQLERYDEKNSSLNEDRYIVIGRVKAQIVAVVVYTPRNGARRIISARYANEKERRLYYGQFGFKKNR